MALVVNKDFDYVKVQDVKTSDFYILAECRITSLYKKKEDYKIVEKIKGSELLGLEYEPLFPYFSERRVDGCFRILAGDFVTSDAGSGIVHCAPGFGEDDYKVSVANNIIKPDDPPVPVDDNGFFT